MALSSVKRELKTRKGRKKDLKQKGIHLTSYQEKIFKRLIVTGGKMAELLKRPEIRSVAGEEAEELAEQWDGLIMQFAINNM